MNLKKGIRNLVEGKYRRFYEANGEIQVSGNGKGTKPMVSLPHVAPIFNTHIGLSYPMFDERYSMSNHSFSDVQEEFSNIEELFSDVG